MKRGFNVKSIEKAMCLTKLIFFDCKAGVDLILKYEDPVKVREITEDHIRDS